MVFVKKLSSLLNNKVDDNETNWLSIYIASVLAFSASVQCSLYFSSMWPFMTVVCFEKSFVFFINYSIFFISLIRTHHQHFLVMLLHHILLEILFFLHFLVGGVIKLEL